MPLYHINKKRNTKKLDKVQRAQIVLWLEEYNFDGIKHPLKF